MLKMIFHNSADVWNENFLKKNGRNLDLLRRSKIGFDDFFKRIFYVSFDIYAIEHVEYWVTYFQVCWENFPSIKECVDTKLRVRLVEMKISKETLKKIVKTYFGSSRKIWVSSIFEEIFISNGSRIVKIIFNAHWRYLKRFPNINECVVNKI